MKNDDFDFHFVNLKKLIYMHLFFPKAEKTPRKRSILIFILVSQKIDMCELFPLNKRRSPRKRRFWKETAKKDAVEGEGL